ncbi:MAG: L-threonylcarbamoyladenylate synthase [Acidimicrobiales bacterium]
MIRPDVVGALDAGRIVALPTDTVYGLAARIDRPGALAAIFAAKGRPRDLALPVLVGHQDQIDELADEWPPVAGVLAAEFWPGPLTLVVPAVEGLGELLGSGGTVGIRLPRHRLVQSTCADTGPLAVTSANVHGRPPCTTAAQVAAEFPDGEVAVVVDGGLCDGVPSTVVDCSVSPPACRRQGAVPWARIEAALRRS